VTQSPVHIALVGLGGHGRRIQEAIDQVSALAVAAVYDPNAEEAEAAAARFGCPAVPSYEAVLARDDLDAVVLATPNHVHRAQTEAAFEAGLDVFVEKPIATTVADGLVMVQRAEVHDRILMVGHNIRRGRAARQAMTLLDDGAIGEVVSVEIHYSADNVQKGAAGGWRADPERCPMLPMLQLGLHAIDLVHYLLAPTRRVTAHARSVLTPPGVVDNVTATLLLENDVAGTAISNYCTPDLFEVRLSGTEGLLEVNWIPQTLTLRPRGARTEEPEHHDYSAFDLEDQVRQFEAFAEAIRTRAAPETDGWAGLYALAVVEAMARSAATGRPVSIVDVFAVPEV
jgi:predicted dehydrogenase